MRSKTTSRVEFLLGLLMMLAISVAAFIWAHAAWLEHYA